MAGSPNSEKPAAVEFRVGQDVRLTPELAEVARREDLASAGTVTGIEPGDDGTFTYTVHFPGSAGVRPGLAARSLEEIKSPAVKVPGSPEALTVKEADERLTAFDASFRPEPRNGQERLDILHGLARTCRVDSLALAKQLLPKMRQRERELDDAARRRRPARTPAAVAASDLPRPLNALGVTAEIVPFQHQAPPPAPAPHRGGPGR